MKINKLSFAAIAAIGGLMVLAPLAGAQEKKEEPKPAAPAAPADGKAAAKEKMKQAADSLGLTDEQKKKMLPILMEQKQKMSALQSDTTTSQADKAAKLQEIRAATKEKLKPIFTPEQFEKWEKQQGQARPGKKKQP